MRWSQYATRDKAGKRPCFKPCMAVDLDFDRAGKATHEGLPNRITVAGCLDGGPPCLQSQPSGGRGGDSTNWQESR